MIIALTDVVLLQWVAVISKHAIAQRLRVPVDFVDCHLELDGGTIKPQFMLSGEGLRLVRAAEVGDDLIREVFAKVWLEEVRPALVQARDGLRDMRYGYKDLPQGAEENEAPKTEASTSGGRA